MTDICDLIDKDGGTQKSAIFHDQGIYDLEMERIFARSWLFLTHEGQIPNIGDYVRTMMGEDEVIVVRQRDGSVKAFLNACRHRGAQVCAAEAGNANIFVCPYHGWGYGIDGSLRAVPLEKELYKGRLDKSTHGLRVVPLVESYHGFVYGCFDSTAPSLKEYLGEMGWYLDVWMDAAGGAELIGPPSRSILNCNWKVPSENFVGDTYHVGWTHGAALKALGAKPHRLGNRSLPDGDTGLQITTRHGHGLCVGFDGGPGMLGAVAPDILAWQAQNRERIERKLGSLRTRFYGCHINSTIFPNNSFLWGTNTFKLWQPRGPGSIEVLTWTIVEKEMPEDMKSRIATSMNRLFGSAGMLEADDSDNMESITQLSRGFVTRQGRVISQMSKGDDRQVPGMPGVVGDCAMGETAYRGFYRFYREMLLAGSWDEIRAGDSVWSDELLSLTLQSQSVERRK
ncbi:phenylpropionate dioxygenase-like ring-hydroxylating dioxygenase large terminal subunit [Novosphingobium hassiacum]|uniref:Phenylpropionate dioxygenase-like ring-hydroxylating dioxygenase large terminal subunit n=1 Tax=Novosphingobium hassiacum TaxID=173676 RepID=A0A7W6A1S4_9SPHN|nr:aromatic ring-hydroxylating dioxygenase subunit alpha [Novosphingobium hassiacum]MBB3862887.1 phenylpropionate dioxygenase-like ring-hydroxylating dioxygenase large terminal subunit [Novosphingobium hassiacum]